MEGSLTDAQMKELDELLASDEETLEYYENYIDTHIALDWHFASVGYAFWP